MSLKFCLYHQNTNHTVKNSFLLPCLSNFWVSFLSNECKEHFFSIFLALSPGRKRKLTKTLRCSIPIQKTELLKTKHSKKLDHSSLSHLAPLGFGGSRVCRNHRALDRIQKGCSDSEHLHPASLAGLQFLQTERKKQRSDRKLVFDRKEYNKGQTGITFDSTGVKLRVSAARPLRKHRYP